MGIIPSVLLLSLFKTVCRLNNSAAEGDVDEGPNCVADGSDGLRTEVSNCVAEASQHKGLKYGIVSRNHPIKFDSP